MDSMLGGMNVHRTSLSEAVEAGRAIGRTEALPAGVACELEMLAERLDKLILINMAMWSLIQEKTGLTEEDLAGRMQEIDLKDGVADAKITRTVKQCGNCGRTISKRHNKCLFCGSQVLTETALEGI